MTALTNIPKAPNGLTPLLSKHLDSQELAQHKATLSLELEVLAKKFDRFGWDRDRGSMAQDRMILDWMEALKDYPLDEVRDACREAVLSNPSKMPNEGHVRAQIIKARGKVIASQPKATPPPEARPEKTQEEKDRVAALVAEAGFGLRRVDGGAV